MKKVKNSRKIKNNSDSGTGEVIGRHETLFRRQKSDQKTIRQARPVTVFDFATSAMLGTGQGKPVKGADLNQGGDLFHQKR